MQERPPTLQRSPTQTPRETTPVDHPLPRPPSPSRPDCQTARTANRRPRDTARPDRHGDRSGAAVRRRWPWFGRAVRARCSMRRPPAGARSCTTGQRQRQDRPVCTERRLCALAEASTSREAAAFGTSPSRRWRAPEPGNGLRRYGACDRCGRHPSCIARCLQSVAWAGVVSPVRGWRGAVRW